MNVRAFTLVELMVTMAIFMLLVLAMVGVQIFGFKMNTLTAGKLKSTAFSVKALDQIQTQVRGASSAVVGNGSSLASFTSTGTNGLAVMIFAPTGGSNLLYLSTNKGALYEIFSSNNKQITVASNLVNQVMFQTVDCHGNNISSSGLEHYAIRMTLQFLQKNYQVPTNVYDYYTFQTEMTPRSQD
ncbi:MAG TPA: prepilin-type N-terminal cleavage/methylation domain-containing protein [Verrucomicrobiae bacterium]|nr:prepilin-type N-terminal cleavage/methylation domain-containing protein [Verrucomicrobiae bacterium]